MFYESGEESVKKKLEDALIIKQETEAQLNQAMAKIAQLEEVVSSGICMRGASPISRL